MPTTTNEAKTAVDILKTIILKGRLVTGDAMFCQRELCEQIVDSGGDYLFVVKDNQPELKAAIAADFQPGFSPRHRKSMLDPIADVDFQLFRMGCPFFGQRSAAPNLAGSYPTNPAMCSTSFRCLRKATS